MNTMVDDGARALSVASTDPFDIIILDYHMPNMSGIEVARALRAGDGPNKTGKILFATAASTPDVIDECKRAGADEMIGKPFKREVLFAALVRLSAGMQIKPDEERRPVAAES